MEEKYKESLIKYSQSFKIRNGEVNAFNELTFPALFDYLGEIAFNHADAMTRKYTTKTEWNLASAWTRMRVVLKNQPRWKEKITIITWVSPFNVGDRFGYRNFNILSATGELIGYGYGSFIFFDLKARKAILVPQEIENYPTFAENIDDHHFSKLSENFTSNLPEYFNEALFSHLDQFQHVNNVHYIKWIIDSMGSKFLKGHQISSAELHFLKEIRLGDKLIVQSSLNNEDNDSKIESRIRNPDKTMNFTAVFSQWRKRIKVNEKIIF